MVFKGVQVAVTGATGFIGRHLVERLLQDGAQPEVMTRDRERVPAGWERRISVVEKDITEGAFELKSGTEVVFHCAGEIRDPRRFYRTNVEGTRNIIDASLHRNVKRFVYLSSVGVMGKERPGTFDETSACSPKNDYEQSKLEAEKLVLEAGRQNGLPAAILRPSIVYGPGKISDGDSFLSLIRSIKRGYFCHIGGDKGIYNIVYVGDVVEALLYLAATSLEKKDNVFIINDPISWGDFISHIRTQIHMYTPEVYKVRTIPKPMAFSLALGCELARIFGIKLPFSMSRFKAITSRTNFSSEKIKKELNFKFLYGNDKGIRDTVDYYRQNNLLQES